MSAVQGDDPLRFLKPRKKQFHLTPTKPSKRQQKGQIPLSSSNTSFQSSSSVYYSNSTLGHNNTISNATKPQHSSKSPFMKNPRTLEQQLTFLKNIAIGDLKTNKVTSQQPAKPNGLGNSSKAYNPMKYFSKEVEMFLRKKRGIVVEQQTQQNDKSKQKRGRDVIDMLDCISQQESKVNNREERQYDRKENKMRAKKITQRVQQVQYTAQKKTSPLRQQQSQFTLQKPIITKPQQPRQPRHTPAFQQQQQQQQIPFQVTPPPQQPPTPISKLPPPQNFPSQQQQQYPPQQSQQQLTPCPTCHRKFNPASFQRHVKVCQKVFYQKRKQFSSQKQRSLSKNSKNNGNKKN